MRFFTLTVTLLTTGFAFGEGYIRPTPIDTSELRQLGDNLLSANPFKPSERILGVGAKAYLYNCSGCHGLEAISGGVAPDLRELTDSESDDAWFISRVRDGYNQNGQQKMPSYAGTLSQEGMWAIRTWINTLPKD